MWVTLVERIFFGYSDFLRNQHCQIPIRSWIRGPRVCQAYRLLSVSLVKQSWFGLIWFHQGRNTPGNLFSVSVFSPPPLPYPIVRTILQPHLIRMPLVQISQCNPSIRSSSIYKGAWYAVYAILYAWTSFTIQTRLCPLRQSYVLAIYQSAVLNMFCLCTVTDLIYNLTLWSWSI